MHYYTVNGRRHGSRAAKRPCTNTAARGSLTLILRRHTPHQAPGLFCERFFFVVPTAQFFTTCPHARLVRGDDLTCQVAEKGLREVVAPGIVQQLFVVVCTRGPEACAADTTSGTTSGT